MGVEPTDRRSHDGPPVLKTGPVTGPAAPPRRSPPPGFAQSARLLQESIRPAFAVTWCCPSLPAAFAPATRNRLRSRTSATEVRHIGCREDETPRGARDAARSLTRAPGQRAAPSLRCSTRFARTAVPAAARRGGVPHVAAVPLRVPLAKRTAGTQSQPRTAATRCPAPFFIDSSSLIHRGRVRCRARTRRPA